LKISDEIIVRKKNGEERFRQVVESMEVERKKIQSDNATTEASILAGGKTKEGDLVYKIVQ
jgi:hypothetical protein